MATTSETLLKKTQRGLSILAFETTKQSRILKKRMRVAALQKEIKADLRDLGNLVYNAIINAQTGILEEEEVKILVQNIRHNKGEVERLRDSIGRLGKAKKHFPEEAEEEGERTPTGPDEEPSVVVEAAQVREEAPRDVTVSTAQELEAAVLDAGGPEPEAAAPDPMVAEPEMSKKESRKKKSSIPPAQGADLEASGEPLTPEKG